MSGTPGVDVSAPGPQRRPRYSIVVPVFNEAATIGEYCRRARTELPADFELLICYDMDADSTLPALAALPADAKPDCIRLIKNNLGPGVRYAIEAGMRAAAAPVVVVMMVDCSDEFGRIDEMVQRAEAGAAAVCASRYMAGGRQIGGPWFKGMLSRTAGVTLHWLTGLPTHDPTNSFKAYRKDFLDATTIESTAGFCLGMELTVKAHFGGRRVEEVPAVWRDRTAGQSRFRLWKWLPSYLHWYFWATDRSRRCETAAILGMLLIGFVIGFGQMQCRPDLVYRMGFLTGEEGNQLYRAERLADGACLYRDVACQYGPIGPYTYAAYTQFVGNTLAANRYWHLAGSLVCIVLAYLVMRRALGVARAFACTVGLALPMLLAPGGIIGANMFFEHLSLERACLLALMLIWRPPPERSVTHSVGLGLTLGIWQGLKFGGAFIGVAALVGVDVTWLLLSRQRGGLVRQWLLILSVFGLIEALGVAIALTTLPPTIAWELIWPAYMRQVYQNIVWSGATWAAMIYFPIQQILPILCLLLSVTGLAEYARRSRSLSTADRVKFASQPHLALWIGAVFYWLASVSYFGHVYHYYQYAWVLAPSAAYGFVRLRRPVTVMAALLLVPVWALLIDITFVEGVDRQLLVVPLPGGEQIYVHPEVAADVRNFVDVTVAVNQQDSKFVVGWFGWGGGGLHHFYNQHYGLRNSMVVPLGFRPFDEDELARKLGSVEALIVEDESQSGSKEAALAVIRRTVAPTLFGKLMERFDPEPQFPFSRFAIFRKRSKP